MTAMNPPKRSIIASVSTGLVLLLGVAACSAQGADGNSSTFQANLPTQSTTRSIDQPATASMTAIPEQTTSTALVTLTVPAKSDREISRVVVNLSKVPGKTSTLTRVPRPGQPYDLRAACVMRADVVRDRAATLELTDSAPGSAPTLSLRVPCDGAEHVVKIGALPSKLALPALTGDATSGLRGYAVLVEH
jgi:hypothetical protein